MALMPIVARSHGSNRKKNGTPCGPSTIFTMKRMKTMKGLLGKPSWFLMFRSA